MEKELQRKYLQLQLLKQQFGALLEEKAVVDERLAEIMISMQALEKLGKVKENEEVLSPLGSGTFVQSNIKDTDKVFVSLGAGVVVKEKREKAMTILKERQEELSKINDDLILDLNKFSEDINRLEPEVQKLAQAKK